MTAFFLFLATAVASCLLTWSWGGVGVEPDAVQQIGYAGALILAISAYISAFTLPLGRYITVMGLGAMLAYFLFENVGVAPRLLNPWFFLSLLMLAATTAYVVWTFRVRVPTVFVPPQASRWGRVVVYLFMVAPVGYFCWLAFWHDVTQDRLRTVDARWEAVTLEQATSGRRLVKFTALDSSMTLTVASDALYAELEAAQKKSVEVQIKETYKHGDMVAWSVEAIDGLRDYSLLDRERRRQP
jgi:glucan phosphoethanolaminetransferase (alkaline phosphatase superfamily)